MTNYEIEDALKEKNYKYLGWQVYYGNNDDCKKCFELGHMNNKENTDNTKIVKYISFSTRGSHDTYWCDECKIWWIIDSSD